MGNVRVVGAAGAHAREASGVGEGSDGLPTVLRFIQLGTIGGLLFVLFVNSLVVRETVIYLTVAPLALHAGVSTFSRVLVVRGQVRTALIALLVSSWVLALSVVAVVPFLWPVMVLTAIVPLVVATPFLTPRANLAAIGGGLAVIAVAGLVGLSFDEPNTLRLSEPGRIALTVGALVAASVPVWAVVWLNNRSLAAAYERLVGLNAELDASRRDLAASRRRLAASADAERSRIERDLHDGAQQRLIAVGLRLRLLQAEAPSTATADLTRSLGVVIDEVDAAVSELRDLAHGIYPPLLKSRGVPEALAAAVRRLPGKIRLVASPVGRYDEPIETALYFVALEGMVNAVKHAPGASLLVELSLDAEHLQLRVVDDGPGFHVDETSPSAGHLNLVDRVAAVGGELTLHSRPGAGTTLLARVPVGSAVAPAEPRA